MNSEAWTYGMLAIPLVFDGSVPVWEKGRPLYQELKAGLSKTERYLFFEIDTQDMTIYHKVMREFLIMDIDVYVHASKRGFHFYSVKKLPIKVWAEKLKQMLREYNPAWVGLALRLLPNKYQDEGECWLSDSRVFCWHDPGRPCEQRYELEYIKKAIDYGAKHYNITGRYHPETTKPVQMLQKKYAIVRYPFDEAKRTKATPAEEIIKT